MNFGRWSGPLLPVHEPGSAGGRPRTGDRVCLTGLIFVLKTGIPWEDFPQEMGCCGMHRQLQEWITAGVWPQLHALHLAELRGAGRIDFSRVIVESASVRAVHGGKKPAPARWTGPRKAPSTIWRSRPTEPRRRRWSRGPTPTT